jgi:hypothetical protein
MLDRTLELAQTEELFDPGDRICWWFDGGGCGCLTGYWLVGWSVGRSAGALHAFFMRSREVSVCVRVRTMAEYVARVRARAPGFGCWCTRLCVSAIACKFEHLIF